LRERLRQFLDCDESAVKRMVGAHHRRFERQPSPEVDQGPRDTGYSDAADIDHLVVAQPGEPGVQRRASMATTGPGADDLHGSQIHSPEDDPVQASG
jgi:hypothetical protein